MAFNLNLNTGGDFLPIAKYDSRAGRLFRVDRDNDTGEQKQVDITDVFTAAIDFTHAETGWACLQPGQAPDFVTAPLDQPLPPRPSANHRQAVRVRIMLSTQAAGGMERLREITITAKTAIRGFEVLYDSWLAARQHNPGRVVLARLAGVRPVQSGGGGQKSTNYEPVLEVMKWVTTPAEFEEPPARAAPNGAATASDSRPAKGGNPPPPPVAKPEPPAAADDWG